jgi:hypothetical protein
MKRLLVLLTLALVFAIPPRSASAQTAPNGGVGEKYWIEFSATWWQPGADGSLASDRLGVIGSQIDFAKDLALESARFTDFRLVLRPAKKHRFRFQYTPIEFTGSSVLSRTLTFAGKEYPISLPVSSTLGWHVWRFGYEWDFFYKPRGFVGVVVQAGITQFDASIESIVGSGEVTGTAPLFELGMVGRFYPIRNLAVNLEGSGMKLTDLEPDHMLKTMAFDFSATYNFTNYVGVSGGWRRTNTNLQIDGDRGELNFSGLWLGGVVRY